MSYLNSKVGEGKIKPFKAIRGKTIKFSSYLTFGAIFCLLLHKSFFCLSFFFFTFPLLFILFLFIYLFILTLQYCIGFAIHQHWLLGYHTILVFFLTYWSCLLNCLTGVSSFEHLNIGVSTNR